MVVVTRNYCYGVVRKLIRDLRNALLVYPIELLPQTSEAFTHSSMSLRGARQFRSCHIQPSSTRYADCGFPRSSLHRHATLPRLLPGRDKAAALQHLSLVFISY